MDVGWWYLSNGGGGGGDPILSDWAHHHHEVNLNAFTIIIGSFGDLTIAAVGQDWAI